MAFQFSTAFGPGSPNPLQSQAQKNALGVGGGSDAVQARLGALNAITPAEAAIFQKIAPDSPLARTPTTIAEGMVRGAISTYYNSGLAAAQNYISQASQTSGGLMSAVSSLLSSGAAPMFLGPLAGSLAGLGNVAPTLAGAGTAGAAGAAGAGTAGVAGTGAGTAGGAVGSLTSTGIPSTYALDLANVNLPGMFGGSAGASAGAGTSGAIGAGGQLLSSAAPIMTNPITGSYLTPAELAATPGALQQLTNAGISAADVAANQNNPSWIQSVSQATGLSPSMLSTVASTGLNMFGSYAQGQAATGAAQTTADAQVRAAQIAADAAKFRPVGVSSRFGQSQFGYDAAGNLTSAGYQLSPEAKAQQDALMGMSNQMLTQYQGAPVAAAPMGTAAQTMFGLGQGYLQTSPQAQAQQYMSEQQALLAPGRERDLAQLQAQMQAQGRGGLAMGGTSTGMQAANPQLEAYYNAKRMQDLQLAAQATQGGQQYAQFGAGMVGAGGDMLKGMYGTQNAAYAPYQTALGGAVGMEQLGQQPMDIGTAIGAKTSTAAAQAGAYQGQGLMNAAATMQPANAYSPWGAMLSGAGQSISNYQTQQQQQQQQQFQNNLMNQFITGRV